MTSPVLRGGLWFWHSWKSRSGSSRRWPRAFYDYVPWVDRIPPYSEHLMRDYGAMNLALALVVVAAAMTMERRLVRVALGAYLLFAVPHLVFHVTHLENFTTAAAVAQTTTLAIATLPIGLLILTRGRD